LPLWGEVPAGGAAAKSSLTAVGTRMKRVPTGGEGLVPTPPLASPTWSGGCALPGTRQAAGSAPPELSRSKQNRYQNIRTNA
jgi:hypothetical protein